MNAGPGFPPLPRSRNISPASRSRSASPPPLEARNLRGALNNLRRSRKSFGKAAKKKRACNKTRRNFQRARNNLYMKALAVANANRGENVFY